MDLTRINFLDTFPAGSYANAVKKTGKAVMTKMNQPPVFCEKYCVICKGARTGNSLCKTLQNLELALLGKNGCYWGKARTRYYGVTPDQKIPDDSDTENTRQ